MNRLCVIAAGIVSIAVTSMAAVTVTPVRISESRVKDLAAKAGQESSHMGFNEGLRLVVRLDGPEVAGATQYGKLKIAQATDDAGTNLLPKAEGFGAEDAEGFVKFRSAMMMGIFSSDRDDPQLFVELRLDPAARKAGRIKLIKGQMQVIAGGESKTVEVKNPGAMLGKMIDDAALKQGGVQIQVLDPKKADQGMMMMAGDGPQVVVQIKGNLSVLDSIKVVDGQGKDLGQGEGSSSSKDVETRSITLSQAPDAQTTLKITLHVGQKTVNVPFELKDVPLP